MLLCRYPLGIGAPDEAQHSRARLRRETASFTNAAPREDFNRRDQNRNAGGDGGLYAAMYGQTLRGGRTRVRSSRGKLHSDHPDVAESQQAILRGPKS